MKQTTLYFLLVLVLFTSCSENNTSKQKSITNNPDSLAGKKTYVNPVDGNAYTTDGEYKKYTPDGGIKAVSGSVRPQNIVLLTDQNKIPAIISIEKLADFIKGVDNVVIKELEEINENGQIIIQFTLYSYKKPKVGLSYEGNFKAKNLNGLFQKVEQFSLDIRTQKDSCIFQSVYGVNEKQK